MVPPTAYIDWLSALVSPCPHLPLPAHSGEEGVQQYRERVSLKGHAFRGRREALASQRKKQPRQPR